MERVKFIVTDKTMILTLPDKIVQFTNDKPEFAEIKELIRLGDEDAIIDRLTKGTYSIPVWSHGRFKVLGEEVLDIETDTVVDKALGKRIVAYAQDGLPFEPMLKFHKKILENENKESAADLYRFLDKNMIAITDDGNFIAYKKVTRNGDGKLFDSHSGKIPNEVGTVVKMERHKVDANRRNQCSYGFHVAGWGYVKTFSGNTILEVEIDPRDVVAVPMDYNDTKMRVCKYFIVCERKEDSQRTEKLVKVATQTVGVKKSDGKEVEFVFDPNPPEFTEIGGEQVEKYSAYSIGKPVKELVHTIEGVDFSTMTAQKIKDYIFENFGVTITQDNKNKSAIIKAANKIVHKV